MTNTLNQVTHYLTLHQNSSARKLKNSRNSIEVPSCRSTTEDNAVSKSETTRREETSFERDDNSTTRRTVVYKGFHATNELREISSSLHANPVPVPCNPETTKRNSSNLSNALFSSRDLDRETNPQTTQTRGKLDPCGPASPLWFSEKTSERNGNGNGVKVRRIRRASRPSPNPTKNL